MNDYKCAVLAAEGFRGDSRKKHPCAGAYFTVEAALLVPVVLCIFIMIIYLSFYLYDRCVLAQDCYVLSYRQSIEKGGRDRSGAGAARTQFGEKIFMLSSLQSGSAGGGTVSVRADGRMDPPLFGLDLSQIGTQWGLHAEESAKRTDPPRDYRRVRRIMRLAGQVLDH